MQTWDIEFRVVDKDKFDALRRGEKRYETRAPDERYRDIAVGDIIRFRCGGEPPFEKRVVAVHAAASVRELIERFGWDVIYPRVHSVQEGEAIFAAFPGYDEKIRRLGLKVMELEDP